MTNASAHMGFLFGFHKPAGPTSHDCVAMIRRALGVKKVGHAGTLDPSAEGVLVVGVGSATRLLTYVSATSKSYIAEIAFGQETATDDAEGEVIREAPAPLKVLDSAYAERVLAAHVGKSLQVPPAYSAISKDGVRAYKAARAGRPLALSPREIIVDQAELLAIEKVPTPVWRVRFSVSSGCYIRALARDIGRYVNTCAHLKKLVRERVGNVFLRDCVGPNGLEHAYDMRLDPLGVCDLEAYATSERELKEVLHGRAFMPTRETAKRIAMVYENNVYGVWKQSDKLLTCVHNFATPIAGRAVCQV